MELKEAIYGRRAVRGYKPDPVPKEVLEEVLRLATRAASGVNSQPWEFAVITGEPLQAIKKYNMDAIGKGTRPDREDAPVPEGVYKDRSREVGKALLTAMGISREDKAGRLWWMKRGFRFFDAPVLLLLLMDKSLNERAYRLDMGCVAQNICLTALEYGLGTCIEDQAVMYQGGFAKYLNLPDNKRCVVGIAIGYPDESFGANHVKSTRVDIRENTTWYGF